MAALVGGDPELGIEPVEDLFGIADGVALEAGVGVGEFGGQAAVVVAVAALQVAAETARHLIDRPVAEFVATKGGRGLQMLQQLPVAGDGLAVRVWWSGWARV